MVVVFWIVMKGNANANSNANLPNENLLFRR